MDDLHARARQLKNTKEFSEAINIYEKIWFKKNNNKWLGWEYAYCLKQINEITKAIAVCKATFLIDKKFNMNNDLMAWCVYEKYFKEKKEEYSAHEIENLELVGESIISLIDQSEKTAYEPIIFSLIAIYKKKGDKKSHTKIIEWLDKLDVNSLNNKNISFKDSRGNDMELQSRKEEYYSLRSKSLLILECYEECISCCEEAEELIDKFHYDNDIWIEARKCYAYGMLGEYDKAIFGMKKLIVKKNHWSLLFNIAQIYDILGEAETSLLYCYKAFLTKDPDKMKVKVIYFVAQKLMDLGEHELANMHYLYCKQIREENNWTISEQLETVVKNISDSDISISPFEMIRIWLNEVKSKSEVYYGKVSRILPNKRNGFISYGKKSVFFKVNETFGKGRVKENTNVSFIIEDSYDIAKKRETKEAKYVEIVEKACN